VESSLRRLALCPAVGTAHCEVMELASKLWSWAQLHNLEFQKSPTVKFWSWAGFCQGRLWHQWQCFQDASDLLLLVTYCKKVLEDVINIP